MNPRLVIFFDSVEGYHGFYIINNVAYDAQTLAQVTLPEEDPFNPSSFIDPTDQLEKGEYEDDRELLIKGKLEHQISFNLFAVTSDPVIVFTENGWIIITTTIDNKYKIIGYSHPGIINEPTLALENFSIPSIMDIFDDKPKYSRYLEGEQLLEYGDRFLSQIIEIVYHGKPLSKVLGTNIRVGEEINPLLPPVINKEMLKFFRLNEEKMLTSSALTF